MQEFSGRTAVITGGASGIGLGMARSFAKRGMQLVLADLNEELLQAAQQEFSDAGVAVVSQICDASKLDEVERLAETAMDTFGGVHVVCSNAGVGIPTSARNVKLSDWEWIINVDLWGPIYAVKTFLPLIEAQGEGHINATSSMAGLISSQMMGAYNVAKHGVVALMAATERELRAKKVMYGHPYYALGLSIRISVAIRWIIVRAAASQKMTTKRLADWLGTFNRRWKRACILMRWVNWLPVPLKQKNSGF